MILSDKTIKEYLSKGLLIENPINIDECIQPGSYDIYIGNQFMIPEPNCSVTTYPGKISEIIDSPWWFLKHKKYKLKCFSIKINTYLDMANEINEIKAHLALLKGIINEWI